MQELVFFQKYGSVEKFEMISSQKFYVDMAKKPMMWCDMLCRYGSKVRCYYDTKTEISAQN